MDLAAIPRALWISLPAYVANMSPVFAAKIAPGWTHPIDGGRLGQDGHRLLGPGKTWRGLAGGAVGGALTALAVAGGAQRWGFVSGWDYGLAAGSSWAAIALFGALGGVRASVGD